MLAHTGLLSWSAEETDTAVDLRAVTDPSVDPLLPGGRALLGFVDHALTSPSVEAGRILEEELGAEAQVMAATVVGNFQMMNRVADATGMPVGEGSRRRHADLIEELGLNRYDHLEAT
ncbi:MAG: hypothetical protein WEA76_03825 [Acidimicrobiia bacterium]